MKNKNHPLSFLTLENLKAVLKEAQEIRKLLRGEIPKVKVTPNGTHLLSVQNRASQIIEIRDKLRPLHNVLNRKLAELIEISKVMETLYSLIQESNFGSNPINFKDTKFWKECHVGIYLKIVDILDGLVVTYIVEPLKQTEISPSSSTNESQVKIVNLLNEFDKENATGSFYILLTKILNDENLCKNRPVILYGGLQLLFEEILGSKKIHAEEIGILTQEDNLVGEALHSIPSKNLEGPEDLKILIRDLPAAIQAFRSCRGIGLYPDDPNELRKQLEDLKKNKTDLVVVQGKYEAAIREIQDIMEAAKQKAIERGLQTRKTNLRIKELEKELKEKSKPKRKKKGSKKASTKKKDSKKSSTNKK